MRQALISTLAAAVVWTAAAPISAAEATRPSIVPLTTAEAQVLIGRSVRTADDSPGGEIRDFILAGPDGRIARVIISSGGILGFGRKLIAVPAEQLHIHGPRHITLDMTTAELEAAPGFRYDTQTKAMIGR